MGDRKFIVGSEEWCSLPGLNLPVIKARIDSGAKTSALHAYHIQPFERDGKMWVRFKVHPIQGNRSLLKSCEAEVVDRRSVKNTSGNSEKRHVIRTDLKLGNETWTVEVTLTNRDSMGYRMLIGREAMRGRILVDPEKSFILGRMPEDDAKKMYRAQPKNQKALDLILLANNPELYSNQRIIEAARHRGHKIRFVRIRECYMNISALDPQVYYRGGEMLANVDAVIPRIRPSMTFYGCSVVRQFQSMGVYCLNDAVSIARSRDKLRCLQILARKKLGMPVTGFAHSPENTQELIRMVDGAPLIVKLLEGAQGRGVVLAETNKAAESVINAFKSLEANILVQEFVKEAGGKDIRCFVINGKVVAAIQRTAAPGEFRANIHLGGTAEAIKITANERKMAVKAAKILGLKVAGVDILRSATGPKILEVNSSPGLEGVESATGKDIASLMIQCIEEEIARGVEQSMI